MLSSSASRMVTPSASPAPFSSSPNRFLYRCHPQATSQVKLRAPSAESVAGVAPAGHENLQWIAKSPPRTHPILTLMTSSQSPCSPGHLHRIWARYLQSTTPEGRLGWGTKSPHVDHCRVVPLPLRHRLRMI